MIQELTIKNGRDWHFITNSWADLADGKLGVIADSPNSSEAGMQGYHFAFYRRLCLIDCTIRFEFQHNGFSDIGIILRAQNSSNYHLLHFPYIGQANNTQNLWAALSRMDGSGYLRLVKLELIRREPANREIWHTVELRLEGRKLQVRIGKNGLFEAEDEQMPLQGFIGLCLFNNGCLRAVTLENTRQSDVIWHDSVMPKVNWYYPALATQYRIRQWPDDLIRLHDGTLLISYMSTIMDNDARSWAASERILFSPMPNGALHFYDQPQFFLNLADSTILFLTYTQQSHDDVKLREWGSLHGQAYCCRSDDDGHTWSNWTNMDNSARLGVAGQQDNHDLTETCAAQIGDGNIVMLARPIYSPWMWESWSHDGGLTWGPCMRGPFPGYATSNLLRTTSGKLVLAHRLPGLTIHTSPDDGRTWDAGTMIDSSIWAMGYMLEIKADCILYVYRDSFESLMRAQMFRVTAHGIEPLTSEVNAHDR